MLGGNTTANIQTKTTIKNSIGEMETTWSDIAIIKGFLDYESGQNDLSKYDAKVQETTHIFMYNTYGQSILEEGIGIKQGNFSPLLFSFFNTKVI